MIYMIVYAFYIWIALADIPPLIRYKQWKTLCMTGIIFSLGFVITIMYLANYSFPSPMMWLDSLFRSLHLAYGP